MCINCIDHGDIVFADRMFFCKGGDDDTGICGYRWKNGKGCFESGSESGI